MIDFARKPEGETPKVSVFMITYNHERFIGQAIESVLMQDVDFAVELVIGEDCSTDRTREIVLEYERKYPDRILVSDYEHNLGAQKNFVRTLEACRGQYVAWLDGDDYWTSPTKLKRQVELLDSRPEIVLCFHAATLLNETSGTEFTVRPNGRKPIYHLSDLVRSSLMPTASAVFRNGLIELPEWFWRASVGDWSTFALLAENGDMAYLDENWCVHRLHAGSIYRGPRASAYRLCKGVIRMQRLLIDHLGAPRNEPFVDGLYASYYWMAHALINLDKKDRARRYMGKCWRECGYSASVSRSEPVKVLLHFYLPWLYRAMSRVRTTLMDRHRYH